MSFLSNRNGLSVGVSQYVALSPSPSAVMINPTLSLNFTNTETLDPRITFTRASSGTFTGSNGLIQSAAINAPRFDYNPVTLASNGLLIEEQRTNLLLQSSAFDDAYWTKARASVTTNAAVSPSGVQDADSLIEDSTASNTHLAFSSSVTVATGTVYTYTVYAKASGRSWFSMQIGTGTEAYGAVVPFCYFNVTTGSVGNSGNATNSITAVGNGWFRCSLVAIATTAATTTNMRIKLAESGSSDSYTGNGTSGLFLWGAQLEAGAFPTSYIPTVAAQVTRSADNAIMTGTNFSSWYNQAEGTFYAEVVYNGQLIGSAAQTNIILIDDGTVINSFAIRTVRDPSAPQADVVVSSGGVNQMDSVGFMPVIVGTTYKRALAYALNNAIPCVNGVLDGATDTLFTVPVGANRFTLPSTSCALYIRKIAYYPQRLPNAQLQALTV